MRIPGRQVREGARGFRDDRWEEVQTADSGMIDKESESKYGK
jgi:hypothetical protein